MEFTITEPGTYKLVRVDKPQPQPEPIPQPIGNAIGKQYLAIDTSVWDSKLTDARFSFKKLRNVKEVTIEPSGFGYPVSTFFDGNMFHHFVWNQWTNKNDYYRSTDGFTVTDKQTLDYPKWIQDVKFIDGYAWGLVNNGTGFDIIRNTVPDDYRKWKFMQSISVTGASDTQSFFGKVQEFIYTRSRGSLDWNTNDPIMMDRRGVKFVTDNGQINLLDPVQFQPDYATNRIRRDYYSCAPLHFRGNDLLHVTTYFKDDNRIPLTRPERITGTGEMYPTLFCNGNEMPDPFRSLVNLDDYRRDWYHNGQMVSHNEVGQIYVGSIVSLGDKTLFYYTNRWGTHYYKDGNDNRHYVGEIEGAQFGSYQSGKVVTKWITPPSEWNGKSIVTETNGKGSCDYSLVGRHDGKCQITFNNLNGCELFGFNFGG